MTPAWTWCALVAGAFAASGCRTVRSTTLTLAEPVLGAVAPGQTADEECAEHPPRADPPPDARVVRFGSWNMHYLGPSRENPDDRRDPKELAGYICASGVSVLALQEIGVTAGPRGPRSALLEAVLEELSTNGSRWDYRLCVYPWNLNESCALAWDTTVFTEVAEPVVLQMPVAPPRLFGIVRVAGLQTPLWNRMPFAVKLSAGSGRSDFVFVPVHFTARVQVKFYEDATEYREKEAEALVRTLRKVREHYGDDDVIVLGDVNTEFDAEDVIDAFVEGGWRDLNCADAPTHQMGMALDRVFVPVEQPEFALQPNFTVFAPENLPWAEFAERLSDHRLVTAGLLVTYDDD